ncbi:MAG: phenylalanine--tRNA ligase beta subunit-related protein [Deltaproteobacteria bacterium]|nr:phenylalanine--tRNA ligase beta subunit-related protein [Deltaproteobacteria bacterium]MCX7953304.1 phenylalanine--tRNA ligase beta subunit-related protein [Deltaproteobacteria bacterium]
MRLSLNVVKQVLEISSLKELRATFDRLGLEVKNVETCVYFDGRSDEIATIETLANRGDHLSQLNIAKELSVALKKNVSELPVVKDEFPIDENLIQCLSPNTISLGICHIRVSPFSLSELKLPSWDLINPDNHPLVALGNYVMKELGQPLHCYSAAKVKTPFRSVEKRIESFYALNGYHYSFPEGTVVIEDSVQPVAVGGIIGSYDSKLDFNEFEIYLESACFNPVHVRKSRLFAKIDSEAGYYFERGVPRTIQELAIRRFLKILELSGISYEVLGYHLVAQPNKTKSLILTKDLLTRDIRVNKVLALATDILSSLGYRVSSDSNQEKFISVEVPEKYEFVIDQPEDLVQEVLRFFDFNSVPKPALQVSFFMPRDNLRYELEQKLCGYLTCNGFKEVITKPFFSPKEAQFLKQLNLAGDLVEVTNNQEAQYAYLKNNNVLPVCRTIALNLNRFVNNPKIFEVGKLFRKNMALEETFLFGGFSVPVNDSREVRAHEDLSKDFLANCVFGCLKIMGLLEKVVFKRGENPLLQFGFEVFLNTWRIASFGAVNPDVLIHYDIMHPVMFFEFSLEPISELLNREGGKYVNQSQISDQPKAFRDLTISLENLIELGNLTRILKDKFDEIELIQVIDRFENKNVTLRFYFQHMTKAFSKSELDELMTKLSSEIENIRVMS